VQVSSLVSLWLEVEVVLYLLQVVKVQQQEALEEEALQARLAAREEEEEDRLFK